MMRYLSLLLMLYTVVNITSCQKCYKCSTVCYSCETFVNNICSNDFNSNKEFVDYINFVENHLQRKCSKVNSSVSKEICNESDFLLLEKNGFICVSK